MPIRPHYVHIHQKPKLGTGFIKRFLALNYRHSIDANGWFDTASCDIALRSASEAQQFLDQYIGNRVAIYVDNPIEPCWEGFINRLTFSAGGVMYTIGLDEMANRVTATYTAANLSATDAQITANGNNADSQSVYGIKHINFDYGYMRAGTGAASVRDTILAQRSWPLASITRGNGDGLLHIEMQGFYHTLEWEFYTNTGTASSQIGIMVNSVRSGLANSTTFFDNADTTDVSANTAIINQEHIKRESAWDTLLRFQEVGDGGNYWVVGVTPTLFQTGTRRLYYRTANTAIEYTARVSDGLIVRDVYGKKVLPWTVRPDRGIRISDMLIGWNGIGDNPMETYIKSVRYDANQQSVDWSGDDDIRAEGVFQLKRYGKPIGKRFGAVRRSV